MEVRTSGRPGTERRRSSVHPERTPCANLGHPRGARRGRHVVYGLRTGTPDAEHQGYTTPDARLVTREVRASGQRPPASAGGRCRCYQALIRVAANTADLVDHVL